MHRLSCPCWYNEITKEIKNSLNKIRVAPKNSQRPRAQKGTEMTREELFEELTMFYEAAGIDSELIFQEFSDLSYEELLDRYNELDMD